MLYGDEILRNTRFFRINQNLVIMEKNCLYGDKLFFFCANIGNTGTGTVFRLFIPYELPVFNPNYELAEKNQWAISGSH